MSSVASNLRQRIETIRQQCETANRRAEVAERRIQELEVLLSQQEYRNVLLNAMIAEDKFGRPLKKKKEEERILEERVRALDSRVERANELLAEKEKCRDEFEKKYDETRKARIAAEHSLEEFAKLLD